MKEYLGGIIGEDFWRKTISRDELKQLLLSDIGEDCHNVKFTHHEDGSVSVECSRYENTKQS